MLLYCRACDFQGLKVSQGKVCTINRWGNRLNLLLMVYLLSNICTKNYWNPTAVVEIIISGWMVSFFETRCSYFSGKAESRSASAVDLLILRSILDTAVDGCVIRWLVSVLTVRRSLWRGCVFCCATRGSSSTTTSRGATSSKLVSQDWRPWLMWYFLW